MPKIRRDPDARTENLNVRVSSSEKEALEVRATQEGKTVSELVRPSVLALAAKGEPEAYPWEIGSAMADLAENGFVALDGVQQAHDLAQELRSQGRDFEIRSQGRRLIIRVR